MKFIGAIGFWEGDIETAPDVYKPVIVEKPYTGDMPRNFRRFDTRSESQEDDLTTSNQISILADLYMHSHLTSIRYILWNGQRFKAKNVTIEYPRVTIEMGGVYHGPIPATTTGS